MPTIPPLSGGAVTDDPESLLRKYLSPALKGLGWDALIAAIAVGDQYNLDTARAAFNQLFLSTASSTYLDRKASDVGVVRPASIGISDDVFRKLTIKTTASKLTIQSLLDTLEAYYGSVATRANVSSGNGEPFALQDGDTLLMQLNEGNIITVTFEAEDFSQISQAKAVEVAAVITRAFRKAKLSAYAIALKDPSTGLTQIQIFSGSLGLNGSVRIHGGRSQNVFNFPTKINTTQDITTQWNVVPSTALNGIPAGRVRISYVGGTNPSVQLVNVGDYANIYGSVFNSANRGAWKIVASTSTYFEIENISGVQQLGVTLSAATDIIFYTPTKFTIQSNGRLATAIQGDAGSLDVILPATTEAVERQEGTGAYLHAGTPKTISSAVRAGGVVTAQSVGHGFATGNWVNIDGMIAGVTSPPPQWSLADAGVAQTFNQFAMAALSTNLIVLCGGNDGTALSTAYKYDVGANTWSAIASMSVPRYGHTLTLLPNGKLLVTGGKNGGGVTVATCELYDPNTDTWSSTGSMANVRINHTATRLTNGKIFVVGGGTGAETYDYVTGTWTATANPVGTHVFHTATLTADGRVLVVAGQTASVELYNPVNNTWKSATNHPGGALYHHRAALLRNDKILVIAGTIDGVTALSAVRIFDPFTLTWTSATSLTTARMKPGVCILPTGEVFVGAGLITGGPGHTTSVEIYDWTTNLWTAIQPTNGNHGDSQALALSNGNVLLAGPDSTNTTQNSELFSNTIIPLSSGRVNGLYKITVTGANSFTYQTTDITDAMSSYVGGTATLATPAAGLTKGPFIYDTDDGLSITETASTTTQDLIKDQNYKTLTITDASDFPDEPGYVVFNFGTDPLIARYLGRISNTTLLLDPSVVFSKNIPSGSSITLLSQRSVWVPDTPETVGSFYATASSAGRVAAEDTIDELVAAGVEINKIIVYPGDRGLGNEGYPAEGSPKLSDKVAVWGSDEIETELDEAREE